MRHWVRAAAFVVALVAAGFAQIATADIILLGDDTNTAAAEYTKTGAFIKFLGPTGATGTAFDGAGHAFVAYGSDDIIRKLDSAGNVLATIAIHGPEDITFINNTLWVSRAFGPTGVTHIDLAGNVLGSFAAGFATGITTDGTFLYSSDGFGGTGVITQRLLDGTPTGVTINTNFGSNLSLGFDAADHSLWMGGLNVIAEFDFSGNKLFSTATGATPFFHDGIAIGDFASNAVPEPSSFVLLACALAGLMCFTRRWVVKA